MGDPAGIGIDTALLAWRERQSLSLPTFALFANSSVVSQRAGELGLDIRLAPVASVSEAVDVFCDRMPIVEVGINRPVQAGKPDVANGECVINAIEACVEAVRCGSAAAVVTNPISKSVLQAGGFVHPGHTEFLGELARVGFGGVAVDPVMMLVSPQLRVVPLTIHMPLREVADSISTQRIVAVCRILLMALQSKFGVRHPRVAIAGLNPHAGEDGRIGREDIDVIAPAVAELRTEGFAVSGPHPGDILFAARTRETYDAALCMYHDQALIPLKALAFDEGVNVTLGLPFVRTSPDHGTAFALAGTGTASPSSLVTALKLAADLAKRSDRMPQS